MISHKATVIELSARPAFAHPDLPINMATRPTANDTGGANIIRTPARSPKREPHPEPGSLTNCVPAESQDDTASQKLIFPIILDFILLYSFGKLCICHNQAQLIGKCTLILKFQLHIDSTLVILIPVAEPVDDQGRDIVVPSCLIGGSHE